MEQVNAVSFSQDGTKIVSGCFFAGSSGRVQRCNRLGLSTPTMMGMQLGHCVPRSFWNGAEYESYVKCNAFTSSDNRNLVLEVSEVLAINPRYLALTP